MNKKVILLCSFPSPLSMTLHFPQKVLMNLTQMIPRADPEIRFLLLFVNKQFLFNYGNKAKL